MNCKCESINCKECDALRFGVFTAGCGCLCHELLCECERHKGEKGEASEESRRKTA